MAIPLPPVVIPGPIILPSTLPSFGAAVGGVIGGTAGAAVGAAAGGLVASAAALFGPPMAPGYFRPKFRSIGGLHAHVTIEEDERDEVTVTEHPVEQGAPIADHAFKRQQEVTVKVGWNMWDGDLAAEGGVYGFLLNWQASFIIFDLVTGKRLHRNMLITSISVSTNQETEFALMATITCREVILSKTEAAKASTGERDNKEGNGTSETKGGGERSTTKVDNPSVAQQITDASDANAPFEEGATPTAAPGDTSPTPLPNPDWKPGSTPPAEGAGIGNPFGDPSIPPMPLP